jgi:hypothetical protein
MIDTILLEELILYFKGKVIGSYLFVQNDLLHDSKVNDVDIVFDTSMVDAVKHFILKGNSYKNFELIETLVKSEYRESMYDYQLTFKDDTHKPFHLMFTKSKVEVFSIQKLISNKIANGTEKDLEQVKRVIGNMIYKLRESETKKEK